MLPPSPARWGSRIVALLVAAAIALTGCGGNEARGGNDKVGVVAAFYPLQFLAERIGGDNVEVTNLVKPGTEPHDMELRPRQLADVVDADLVLYLSGFQPAVDEAVKQEAAGKALDVLTVTPTEAAPEGADDHTGEEGHAGEGDHVDAHVWLDPTRFAAIGDRVAERLAELDPDHAAAYRERAAALRADLDALDKEYAERLKTCARRELITSHAAFGYLAQRYGLTQIPVTGLSPEAEAGPGRMAEVADLARAKGATTIFFETLVSPKVAQALADEVGAKTAVLDPIEGLDPNSGTDDYLSVMRRNLDTLVTALDCR
ncbi:metal ABC transporter substrate-binding protein [Luedemannella helvata]|uniref:Zinc ABC transporter substrate-binding protein n=1 Tax=Luedemannella helvata TaxID=349315 RepID=A0ABN2L2C5_9ACTN